MDPLNLFFGFVGIVSFVFSIYIHFKTESRKSIEAAKAAMQKERFRSARYSLSSVLHSIDAIVQIPKKGEISVDQLQNIARVARAQTYILALQLETEEKRLQRWKYGELIDSEVDVKEPNITDFDKQKPVNE